MRRIAISVAVAVAATLFFLAVCGVVNAVSGRAPMPSLVGNRPEDRPDRSVYRVAVLGDAQKGLANLSRILDRVKREKVDFILQTGDLVSHNDEGHYRVTALYLSRAGIDVPFYVVPGNHDVKGGAGRFQKEIGPREFSFRRGRVFFVALDDAMGEPPAVPRIEERMARAGPEDAVVLAMHVPPFDAKGNPLPGWGEFTEWLKRSRVRYLLCGHIHGYLRLNVGETGVIANGVGGDSDSGQRDQPVEATLLEVDGASIRDRRIEIAPEHGFVENVEHLAIAHVAEAYRAKPFLCWTGTVLLVSLGAVAFRYARRPAPPDPGPLAPPP